MNVPPVLGQNRVRTGSVQGQNRSEQVRTGQNLGFRTNQAKEVQVERHRDQGGATETGERTSTGTPENSGNTGEQEVDSDQSIKLQNKTGSN